MDARVIQAQDVAIGVSQIGFPPQPRLIGRRVVELDP
jgi:hypothetical protein